MNNGIYAASTGLLARTQELDLAANNLANANTSGFRGERVSFKTQMMTASANVSTRAANSFGVLGSPRTDFSQGSLQQTGNPLDLALEGSASSPFRLPPGYSTPATATSISPRTARWLRRKAIRFSETTAQLRCRRATPKSAPPASSR